MEAAKWHRLNDIAVDPETVVSGSRWTLDMKDDFNKCSWSSSLRINPTRFLGSFTRIPHDEWELARKCLTLRRRWVAWSEDVLWREALQPHLQIWQYLKRSVMQWPVNPSKSEPARRLSSASSDIFV